jgi:hypothetical protein
MLVTLMVEADLKLIEADSSRFKPIQADSSRFKPIQADSSRFKLIQAELSKRARWAICFPVPSTVCRGSGTGRLPH